MKKLAILVLVMVLTMQMFTGCSPAVTTRPDSVKKVAEAINYIRQNNCYLQVNDSESTYSIQVYNRKGEVIVQSGEMNDIRIYRNDAHSIIFTDKVYYGADIDILGAIENTLALVDSGVATITEVKSSGDNGVVAGITDIELKVDGIDNVKKVYSPVGEEFATNITTGLMEATAAKQLGIKYNIIIGNSNELSVICYIMIDGEEFTSWTFDGYIELSDWELDPAWYEDDWSDADKAAEILGRQLTAVDNMLHEYAEANGIEQTESSSSEVTGGAGTIESADEIDGSSGTAPVTSSDAASEASNTLTETDKAVNSLGDDTVSSGEESNHSNSSSSEAETTGESSK